MYNTGHEVLDLPTGQVNQAWAIFRGIGVSGNPLPTTKTLVYELEFYEPGINGAVLGVQVGDDRIEFDFHYFGGSPTEDPADEETDPGL